MINNNYQDKEYYNKLQYFENVLYVNYLKLIEESVKPVYRGSTGINSFESTASSLAVDLVHFRERFPIPKPDFPEWWTLVNYVNTHKHHKRDYADYPAYDLKGTYLFEVKDYKLRFIMYRLNLQNRTNSEEKHNLFICLDRVISWYISCFSELKNRKASLKIKNRPFVDEVTLNLADIFNRFVGIDIGFCVNFINPFELTMKDQDYIITIDKDNNRFISIRLR